MIKDQPHPSSNQVIEINLNVALEEYKSLREELLANIDASRQVLNLTLTGAGLFLAVSPSFVKSQLSSLFLVVPFLFYAMAWVQLRYLMLGQDIGNYLKDVVEPQMRKHLAELAPAIKHDLTAVLGWSSRGGGLMKHHKNILVLPIAAANYGLPLLAAIFSAVAYLVITLGGKTSINPIAWLLLALNGLALIYSIVWGFWVEFKS